MDPRLGFRNIYFSLSVFTGYTVIAYTRLRAQRWVAAGPALVGISYIRGYFEEKPSFEEAVL